MIIHASSKSYSPAEEKVIERVQSEVPLVLVTRREDFVFNEELLKLDKYVLIDMVEYGWDWDLKKSGTHFFGVNTHKFPQLDTEEYRKFDDFVKNNKPKVYFKRELLIEDVNHSNGIYSISYPYYFDIFDVQEKEHFDRRPIELNHYFGRSSEYRMIFQGNANIHCSNTGIELCDNIYYLQGFLNEHPKRLWNSVHIPHFARLDIMEIMNVNQHSKLSLSMSGCGSRCFRDAEASSNSIMVLRRDGVAFPFEWIDGINCIMYDGHNPIPAIESALKREDLYEIYKNGVNNSYNYQIAKFSSYLESTIKKHA